jgi:hypothetical protein
MAGGIGWAQLLRAGALDLKGIVAGAQAHDLAADVVLLRGAGRGGAEAWDELGDDDLALLGGDCADVLPDLLHLVVEGLLLLQVAELVPVSFELEVVALLSREGLPFLADLLHDLEGPHFRVSVHDQRPGLLDEDHVGGEALLGFLEEVRV